MDGTTTVRKRPALFRALGGAEPPPVIEIDGNRYGFVRTFKHDSWAATALYEGPDGLRVTCKFNRVQPIFILPMRWLGRRLARREADFLRRLDDQELVPSCLGTVTANGAPLPNAAARVYVEGEPFRTEDQVDRRFFAELEQVLTVVHQRQMAYVDLHKRENIIVDPDGRPHLIDFQVSYALGSRWPANGRIARWLLAQLQETDRYHFGKHILRCLHDELTSEERLRYGRRPALISIHRKLTVPLRSLRRKLLVRLGIRDRSEMAGSELEPEDAFRGR
ncbi:MAG: hypothetical protein F9K19_06920 [Rhizobiaceae bacterium]|nr:MAG: hypothetical protein F9K19_06920 [Rhizobiaceae bacterium]CAG1016126.1 hypothetical protein RHIZO_05280 [Rhizobiaceae bacterium]